MQQSRVLDRGRANTFQYIGMMEQNEVSLCI
jgi:hypothetical protein